VGKTCLAAAAGHAARERGWFDGTLFIDLHGYGKSPVAPPQALESLLRDLGVAQAYMPPDTEGRQRLYRSRLAQLAEEGRALLVVADNAGTAEQVRPLIPPTGRHRFLVTSRNTLHTLGARLLDLNVLTSEASVDVLDRALRITDPADSRISRNTVPAQTLARLCGHLPLALQIAAALLVADPEQPVVGLVDRLAEFRTRLEHLDDGERAIRASFSLSLDHLTQPLRDTFRLLALNPGTDIGTEAAAALTGSPPNAVRPFLLQLVRAHLLERGPAPERWRMHDLIRAFAAEQVDARIRIRPHAARTHGEARHRLLKYYTVTAEAARPYVDPQAEPVRSPRFGDREQAAAWLDAEIRNLVAVSAGHTSAADQRLVVRLHEAVRHYLNSGYIHEWLTIASAAAHAARELGDHESEAGALEARAIALVWLHRVRDAEGDAQRAWAICHQRRNRKGEASAADTLGIVAIASHRPEAAADHHRRAISLYHDLGDHRREARAWTNLAQSLTAGGPRNVDEALRALDNAAGLLRGRDDARDSAHVLMTRGNTLGAVGRLDEAIDCLRTAVAICRACDAVESEARALTNLGGFLMMSGSLEEAVGASRSAVEAHRRAWADRPVPSPVLAGALATYAAALHHTRKKPAVAAVAVEEALILFDRFPGEGDVYQAWARDVAADVLARLGRRRKYRDVRRRLQARIGTQGASRARRRRRRLRLRTLLAQSALGRYLSQLPRAAWVAVVGCGFTEARAAHAPVWLLVLYCVLALFATGFLRLGGNTLSGTGHSPQLGCACAPTLLTIAALIVSLVAPEFLGPLNTAGEVLARFVGLA
jgi:tetratricopeptide (TPR) repeat protein